MTPTATDAAVERRDALVERLFLATVGTWDVLAVYIGDRLGLYRTLAERGAMTSAQLADADDLSERYVREWLEQQAASAILDVDRRTPPRATGATACRPATTRRSSTTRA